MPEALVRNELPLMNNADGSAGECPLLHAGAQDIKGALKLFVLAAEGLGQILKTRVIGTLVQKMSSRCFCFRFITHSVQR